MCTVVRLMAIAIAGRGLSETPELHFELGRRAEARAVARRGRERLHEAARRMPVDERPPRHDIVHVGVAVDVFDV